MENRKLFDLYPNGQRTLCRFVRNCKVQVNNKSWRKRLWLVWLEGNASNTRRFLNRNAAIMWLKRYGADLMAYRLNGKLVCVVNNFVYFFSREHGLMISSESKRTCVYGQRNN